MRGQGNTGAGTVKFRKPETGSAADAHRRDLVIGMAVNAGLTICKFVIGAGTHCAALVADGFKDLSDAVHSGLSLELRHLRRNVSRHREQRSAAVRFERILAFVVLLIVAGMGLQSLIGSVRDLLDQHDTHYTPALFVLSASSAAIKAYMASHRRRLGMQLHDAALVRAGRQAAVDSAVSGAILVAAVLDHVLHVDVDPWVGFGIGVLILVFAAQTWLHSRKLHQSAGT